MRFRKEDTQSMMGHKDVEFYPAWILRMLYVYPPSQKFSTIRTSVLRDIIKIFKKSTILKISKTYILHNNNDQKLLNNWKWIKNCPISNQVNLFFISNKFIDFSESIWIFWIFFYGFKNFWKLNVTLRILDMFL